MTLRALAVLVVCNAALTGCTTLEVGAPPSIQVSAPNVYNDASLGQRLQQVRSRLAGLYGLEQTQLSSHIGAIQGASLRQFQANVQATMQPVPGVQTVNTVPSPISSTSQTASGTTSTTGAANTTSSTTSSTETSSVPSSTVQTTTTSPTVTPAVPAIPTTPVFAAPSQFSLNALSTLNEQLQLEMELVTLQTLLEPPVSADYSPDGNARRRITLGFPVTIPPNATRSLIDAAAEVSVTVCSPGNASPGSEASRPSLINIIPKEKTYNTAAVTNKSVGFGLGAVVGVFNVGGNFSWTRDTYYLVRAQDTVAFQGGTPVESDCSGGVPPLQFGWLFKPVLGQKMVQGGLRESLVQLSLPRSGFDSSLRVVVRTQWRRFDPESGAAGGPIAQAESVQVFPRVQTSFDTLRVVGLEYQDIKGGLGTVTVAGHFLPGTRVRFGTTDIANVDINETGLRFTAANQALATSTITLFSPDGNQLSLDNSLFPPTAPVPGAPQTTRILGRFTDIASVNWPGKPPPDAQARIVNGELFLNTDAILAASATLVRSDGASCAIAANSVDKPLPATTRTVSGSAVEVILPVHQCLEVQPEGTYPLIAVLGNRAFGFPEAPFYRRDSKQITFLAPRSLVEGAGTVELQRLLLGRQYRTTYALPRLSKFRVDSISIGSASKTEVRFLILGSALNTGDIVSPPKATLLHNQVHQDGTMQEFSLSSDNAAAIKKVVFQRVGEPPYVFDLPQQEKKDAAKPAEGKKDPKAFTMSITGTLPK